MRPALAAALALLLACATPGVPPPPGTVAELEAALRDYAAGLVAGDAHGLGATFAEQGALVDWDGARHVGPRAVEAHLRTFADYRVLESRMVAAEVRQEGEGARQRGTAYQRVTLPSGETVEVTVRFEASWVREGGRWRLLELSTAPLPVAQPVR